MQSISAAAPDRGDGIVRVAVIHGGRRTSVSMDSSIWALLIAQGKTHEEAREWVRAQASAMGVSAVRSPSLSRRIQSAIIQTSVLALQGSFSHQGG